VSNDRLNVKGVVVLQKETSVVTIVSKGPKGDSGKDAVTPGLDRQIIFNSGSVLGTDSNFVFNSLGRLGIGTSAPTNTLQVVGGVTATSFTGSLFGTASQALTASFINTASTNAFVQGGNSFGTTALLGTNDNQDLQFETSGSVRMTISSTGDIVSLEKVQIQNKLEQGVNATATGPYSHAEGNQTTATGQFSHAEGKETTAFGNYSHTEGEGTIANGLTSHAEGYYTITNGQFSHAEGNETIAGGDYQLTIGQYNTPSSAQSAFIIGNGVDSNNRSNLLFASGSQVQITGSLNVNGSITGSLFGTSSWAQNALTSSFITPTSTNAFVQGGNSFGTTALLGTNDNQDLQFETSGSVRMTISSSGNVGIGTITPTNTLQVVGGVTATSFTGSFSGSIRAPGSNTQLIFNNAGVLAGTSNITYANNNLSIGGFTHIISDTLASQGEPQLLVGDGTGNETFYAIIPKIYTSKGAAAQGQKSFASRQKAVEGRQVQEFFIETGIIGGKPSTGTESPILTLTDQERVGIGTIDPRAKLEVLGSVLISGSSTLTNIGPAIFSGSITQQPIFTASLGYLTSTGAIISGNVTVTGTASINTLQINQTILSTGSNQLGDNTNDTQTLYGSVIIPTGSLTVTGSLNVNGSITGSLFGTSSWAQNALTASFLPIGTYNITSSNAVSAQTASFLPTGTYNITSSWAQSASNAVSAQTASFLPTGTYNITSSWAQNALTSSFITPTGTNAFVQGGNSFGTTTILGTNDNQDLQFETSGSVRMTISSSGNVGIGTTNPLSTLTVAGGNINISTGYGIGGNNVGSFSPFIRYNTNAGIVSSSFGHGTAYMLSDGAGAFGANDLSFYAGAFSQPEIMRIVGSTGFVGIGESSPSAKLEIKGSGATSATTALRVENSNASASLVVRDDGNVGIGTSTPTNTLQVVGGVTATSFTGSFFGTSSWAQNALTASFLPTGTYNITSSWAQNALTASVLSNISTNIFVQGGNSFGTATILGTNDNQDLQFETSGSVRMTISSSGNVGIGTITPTNTLNVNGTTFLQGGQTTVRGSGATSTTTALRVENSAATARLTILDDGTSAFNTSHLYISSSGNVGIGTTTPTTRLHISGASNSGLFEIDSPAVNNIIYVSGSGNVGIGTGTPSARLHINGDTILSGSLYTYGSNSDIDSGSFRTIITVATSSYRAAFFDYVLTSGSNARAGTVFSVWQGTNVEYADTSTNDIGNTSGVNLLVSMSGANIGLFASSSNDNWSMKALARLI